MEDSVIANLISCCQQEKNYAKHLEVWKATAIDPSVKISTRLKGSDIQIIVRLCSMSVLTPTPGILGVVNKRVRDLEISLGGANTMLLFWASSCSLWWFFTLCLLLVD